jgi:hypothetical protein
VPSSNKPNTPIVKPGNGLDPSTQDPFEFAAGGLALTEGSPPSCH